MVYETIAILYLNMYHMKKNEHNTSQLQPASKASQLHLYFFEASHIPLDLFRTYQQSKSTLLSLTVESLLSIMRIHIALDISSI